MPLSTTRRAPWVAGAVLLALVGALVAPVVLALGWRRWPFYAGLAAVLVLTLGALERWWQSRPPPSPRRTKTRSRFRVVPGGKGNGHDLDGDDQGEKPRWVM